MEYWPDLCRSTPDELGNRWWVFWLGREGSKKVVRGLLKSDMNILSIVEGLGGHRRIES